MNGKNRTKRLFLVVFLISVVLLLQIQPSHAQVPILTIAPITWNVIGLDSNDVMAGPDTFLVAARVCNNSGVVANNVESTFVWDSDNPYINLTPGSPSTLTIPSLPVDACTDFYYNVSITRTTDAYDTARRYHITATATGFDPASTPAPRELYVEHLVSQNRNSVVSISGPTTVFVGQTYTYVVVSQTATNGYEQLESFLNFPNNMFKIESVAVTYTVGGTGDTLYADACGWHNDPTLPDYKTCTTTDKAGGTVTTTYTVLILSAGEATMSALVYDFSGSSYHYNSSFGAVTITVDASEPTPGLSLVKTATPATYNEVGDVINYSYLLTNTGNVTLDGPFTVTDNKVTVTCPSTPASLAPGESITCTGSYIITQADLDNGSVTNTATGHGFYGTTPVDSNEDTETVIATQGPALTLVKSVTSNGPYDSVGDVVTYQLVATNTGNVVLRNVSISDPLLGVLTCAPPQPATLAPGESLNCTGSHTITQADLDAGSYYNIATADSDDTIPVTDDVTVPITQNPELTLVKTATPATYNEVGDVISYSYVLTNSGNETLSGPFTVTDNKVTVTCPSTPASLAPGESITCTGSYIITQADLDNGSVTNTATGHGYFGTTPVDSNQTGAVVHRNAIPVALPVTGFAPGRQTFLSVQPDRLNYANLGEFWLEIPALNIQAPIVGVPLDQDGWNLDWLGDQIGYLEGTAFPTWNGNSVLTAHVYNASGLPGPFVNLGKLMWGDQVIVHGWGQSYIFEIRSVQFGVNPEDTSVITHEEKPWLTLITCQGYDEESDSYSWRIVAKAVLITVK